MSAAYPVVWRSVFTLVIEWVGELLFYLLTLLYVALVVLIFYGGGQAEIERQVNAAIEQENQTSCERRDGLGTPYDSDCTAALTDPSACSAIAASHSSLAKPYAYKSSGPAVMVVCPTSMR